MVNFLEAMMIICFGLSWPLSIYRSWTSRTAKGKSLFFEIFLWIGYGFGITRKIILTYTEVDHGFMFYLSFIFYVLNMLEITIDICLYFRNIKLDKIRDAELNKELAEAGITADQEH